MKSLILSDVPVWYELGWEGGSAPAVILSVQVHALVDALRSMRNLRSLPLLESQGRIGCLFAGFDRVGVSGDHAVYRFEIPRLVTESGRPDYDWRIGRAAARTLSETFRTLRFFSGEDHADTPQLFTIEPHVRSGERESFPLSGELSPALLRWFRHRGTEGLLSHSIYAMTEAWRRMVGLSDRDVFHAWTEPDGFVMECPPGRCTLGVDRSREPFPNGGQRFSSSNVDTPWQQIAFLAGLAALHDTARKEVGELRKEKRSHEPG